MIRRTLIAIAALALFGVCSSSALAAGQGITVASVSSTTWPSRSYVLTLPPGTKLDPAAVHVTENGTAVTDVSVIGGTASAKKFGVVLLIDASESMHGAPIANAMKAARAFAAQRAPNQPLAVVVFSKTPRVLLPFTTNTGQISAALATTPGLAQGTHIFDAADEGISLLATAHIKSGSLVLLSDGSDTGSTATLDSVTADAAAAGVRIFTVGLEGNKFDPTTLTTLAQGAGGAYSDAASAKQLSSIFDQLGAQLANQYVIQYQSLTQANQNVTVQVSVDHYGTAAAFSYKAPSLKKLPTNYNPSLIERFWTSLAALVAVAIVCALLLAYAVLTAVQPGRRAMRRRVTRYVQPDAIATTGDETPTVTAIAETLYERTEQTLAGKPRWERFKEEVDISGISFGAAQLMVLSLAGGLALAMVLAVLSGTKALALLGLLGPFLAVAWVNSRAEVARNRFAEQLPVNLEVLASALRSGHSLTGALRVVIEDAAEPSRSEFTRIVSDEQAGMQLETAFDETVRRMQNNDLRQIAIVSQIQREAGGNTAEVLDRVTENIRARFELRRLVKTLTAQGRMSRWVVTALPVVLLLFISLLNPTYLHPLFHTTVGLIMFFVAVLMVTAGSWFIKKIVKIEL